MAPFHKKQFRILTLFLTFLTFSSLSAVAFQNEADGFRGIKWGVALCDGGELIEPTRTLEDAGARWGKLVVFSEPPEFDVFLDGSKVGQTPVWLERVKEGTHKIQIKDLEKEIYVKEGKILKVGLFKGRFITRLEEEKEVEKQAGADKKAPASKVEAVESPEKQKEADLSRWEKFVNGTLKHF